MCGEYLLANKGANMWFEDGKKPLAGFSHGMAGFAAAFALLYRSTSRAEFLLAMQECLAYENSLYSEEHMNWADLRNHDQGTDFLWSSCQWCHGAGGVGLSRNLIIQNLGKAIPFVFEDLNRAVEKIALQETIANDSLCCGKMGNIEFLFESAKTLQDRDLYNLADERLKSMRQRTSVNDYVLGIGDAKYNLGLFKGLAGIGYTLLRHENLKGRFPNILIWE